MVLEERERYLILRKAYHPLPRYKGPYSSEYFAEAIQTMSYAHIYGVSQTTDGMNDILKPKHIRFDDDGNATVSEYYVNVDMRALPKYAGNKNIHQLAAEYNGWIKYHINYQKKTKPQ